jgi:hypothetical protein
LFGRIKLISTLTAVAIATASCTPAISFANLSDEQMTGLFPTAAEVDQAYGGGISVSVPKPVPASQTSTPPTLDPGVPEDCRGAFLGNDETRSLIKTRMLEMTGSSSDPSRLFSWKLRQHPSADEAKRFVDAYKGTYEKCPLIKLFDLGTGKGLGSTRASADGVSYSTGAVAVGDATMTFGFYGKTEDENRESVRRMAAAVERRLQASGK